MYDEKYKLNKDIEIPIGEDIATRRFADDDLR